MFLNVPYLECSIWVIDIYVRKQGRDSSSQVWQNNMSNCWNLLLEAFSSQFEKNVDKIDP